MPPKTSRTYTSFFWADFRKAFDNISHDLILATLRHLNFPPWFLNAYTALISNVRVFMTKPFLTNRFIDILRGVKQGDPLSPLIFLIVLDPLLHKFLRAKAKHGFARINPRGFADDVAISFASLRFSLSVIRPILDKYTLASGSHLNMKKSLLLSAIHTPASLLSLVSHSVMPEISVVPSGKYLGVLFGSQVNVTDVFRQPTIKFSARIRSYQPYSRSLPLSTKIVICNSFLIPVFSYVTRFFIIPDSTLKDVRQLISFFLRIPMSTMDFLQAPRPQGLLKTSLRCVFTDNLAALASIPPFPGLPHPAGMDPSTSLPPHLQNSILVNQAKARSAIRFFYDVACPSTPPFPKRKHIYKKICLSAPFADEKLISPLSPHGHRWDHTNQDEYNRCRSLSDHPPRPALSAHARNFISNLKQANLPDFLNIFQFRLFCNSLLTNSHISYFSPHSSLCPLCGSHKESLRSHLLLNCSPVKTALSSVASSLSLPYLSGLSPLSHSLSLPISSICSRADVPSTCTAKYISSAIANVVKINFSLWLCRSTIPTLSPPLSSLQITQTLVKNFTKIIRARNRSEYVFFRPPFDP